jgi:hypothetical protein
MINTYAQVSYFWSTFVSVIHSTVPYSITVHYNRLFFIVLVNTRKHKLVFITNWMHNSFIL